MRLLNTRTRELHEFFGENNIPKYAIFSHVGNGSSEVSCPEWKRVHQLQKAEKLFLNCDPVMVEECRVTKIKAGYVKIEQFMVALQRTHPHIEWAHMNTLCVDYTSSTEVFEAVNSSYRWCQRAATCLAFLDDVPIDLWPLKANPEEFRRARWFRRCWTLAELVAPPEVRFFDSGFNLLSTRRELSDIIHGITKVDERFLAGGNNNDPQSVPAAHRIAWAAKRETTKPEDVAYSLMGLLDIRMTPRYGEGEAAAFRRLQKKLLKETGDSSLLAWGFQGSGTGRDWTVAQRSGPFASHPAQFAACLGISPSVPPTIAQTRPSAEYEITNRGLWITTTLVRPPNADRAAAFSTDYVYAVLGCSFFDKRQVLLPLLPARRRIKDKNISTIDECNEFWRAPSCTPICVRPGVVPLDPSLRRRVLILREAIPVELLSLQIQGLDSAGYRMALQEIWPPTVSREGYHYIPLDAGYAPEHSSFNGNSPEFMQQNFNNGIRRSRSSSSGRNTSVEISPIRTQWILLRLWTYFENVVVMIRYRGKELQEGPVGLLPPMAPRQVNPIDVKVKVLSLAQLMENYTSPSSEDPASLPRSLEDYFWARDPTTDRLEELFSRTPRFRHPDPVRAYVRSPAITLTHEQHEQQARQVIKKLKPESYRLPQWVVELTFDSTNLGAATSLGGL